MQRTVWNWLNLGKCVALLLTIAVIWQLFCWAVNLRPAIGAALGVAIGMTTMMTALARWPAWSFEWTED